MTNSPEKQIPDSRENLLIKFEQLSPVCSWIARARGGLVLMQHREIDESIFLNMLYDGINFLGRLRKDVQCLEDDKAGKYNRDLFLVGSQPRHYSPSEVVPEGEFSETKERIIEARTTLERLLDSGQPYILSEHGLIRLFDEIGELGKKYIQARDKTLGDFDKLNFFERK